MREKTELVRTKIILHNANLQFFSLSEEVNSAWPLVPYKQTEVFSHDGAQDHHTANSGQLGAQTAR